MCATGGDQEPLEAPREALESAAAVAATAAASWRFEARLQGLESALRTLRDDWLAEKVQQVQCSRSSLRGCWLAATLLMQLRQNSVAVPFMTNPTFCRCIASSSEMREQRETFA